VHRDIKPANVIIAKDGQLASWTSPVGGRGLGKSFRRDADGAVLGRPSYVARADRGERESIDRRADVYSSASLSTNA